MRLIYPEFISKFIKKFYLSTASSVTAPTKVVNANYFPAATIYALISNLLSKDTRQGAVDWLISSAVDAHSRQYTQTTVEEALMACGFNNLVSINLGDEMEKETIVAAVDRVIDNTNPLDAEAFSQITPSLRDQELLANFTMNFTKNFVDPNPPKVAVIGSVYSPTNPVYGGDFSK